MFLIGNEFEAGSGSVHDREMQTLMNLDNLTSIDQLAEFLSGTQTVAFSVLSHPAARYEWVQKTLVRFRYLTLSRPHQGVVIRVLIKVSGYSRQQLTRLIAQYRTTGTLKRRQRTVTGFTQKYTPAVSDCWRRWISATTRRVGRLSRSSVSEPYSSSVRPNMSAWHRSR